MLETVLAWLAKKRILVFTPCISLIVGCLFFLIAYGVAKGRDEFNEQTENYIGFITRKNPAHGVMGFGVFLMVNIMAIALYARFYQMKQYLHSKPATLNWITLGFSQIACFFLLLTSWISFDTNEAAHNATAILFFVFFLLYQICHTGLMVWVKQLGENSEGKTPALFVIQVAWYGVSMFCAFIAMCVWKGKDDVAAQYVAFFFLLSYIVPISFDLYQFSTQLHESQVVQGASYGEVQDYVV